MILVSAVVAGLVSIDRLLHPQQVTFLWAVAAAALVGFTGNEAVARLLSGEETRSAVQRSLQMASTHGQTGLRALQS